MMADTAFAPTYEDLKRETPSTPNIAISDFTKEEIDLIYSEMTASEKKEFDILLRNSPPRALMPHQIVPLEEQWWETMLLVGGRGTGKTVCGATAARNHLRQFKADARIGIGAPTTADARDTCAEGDTGLITMFPNEFIYYNRSLGEARHIYGGLVKFIGTEKEARWNGPQWSMLWFDELALCNQNSWNAALFGLRLGHRPYAVATTTPKNRKWIKTLALDQTTYVPQYYAENGKLRLPTTFDNLYLPQRRVDWLKNKFGNSRLGRQELDGVFLEDISGAMWNRERDFVHVLDRVLWPKFQRIVVAIDPAGTAAREKANINALTEEQKNNQEKTAETAIAVVGIGVDNKFYLIEIVSGRWLPDVWAEKAITLFTKYSADRIVAEKNYGGLMVESTLRNVNKYSLELKRQINGRHLPIVLVTASRGKAIRAEPVAVLYQQHRVIHCRYFGEAEDQMCAFVNTEENEGADMVDAIVWGITDLAGLDMTGSDIIVLPGDPRFRSFIVK